MFIFACPFENDVHCIKLKHFHKKTLFLEVAVMCQLDDVVTDAPSNRLKSPKIATRALEQEKIALKSQTLATG